MHVVAIFCSPDNCETKCARPSLSRYTRVNLTIKCAHDLWSRYLDRDMYWRRTYVSRELRKVISIVFPLIFQTWSITKICISIFGFIYLRFIMKGFNIDYFDCAHLNAKIVITYSLIHSCQKWEKWFLSSFPLTDIYSKHDR